MLDDLLVEKQLQDAPELLVGRFVKCIRFTSAGTNITG